MSRGVARVLFLQIVCFGASWIPAPVAAQTLIAPSFHFGAWALPEIETKAEIGFHLDRFTEFGKGTVPGDQLEVPYNGIDSTIGLNSLAAGIVGRFRKWPSTVYRLTAQLGFGHNQPTEFLQNEVIHHVLKLRDVPDTLGLRTQWDAGISLDINRWVRSPIKSSPLFVGAGISVSTVVNDAFFQAGFRGFGFTPSLLVRFGGTLGGDAFPSTHVARWYRAIQTVFPLPADRIFGWLPRVEIGLTETSGLFVAEGGTHITESFCSLLLTWRAVTVETWNDLCFGGDQGPTFGLRVYFRSRAFRILDWI